MKKFTIFIIIILIIGAVMYATNPTMDDFSEYLSKKADRNIEKYSSGSKNIIDEIINGAKTSPGVSAKSRYERADYYVFSVFESDSSVLTYGKKHLGIFKFFLKLE